MLQFGHILSGIDDDFSNISTDFGTNSPSLILLYGIYTAIAHNSEIIAAKIEYWVRVDIEEDSIEISSGEVISSATSIISSIALNEEKAIITDIIIEITKAKYSIFRPVSSSSS